MELKKPISKMFSKFTFKVFLPCNTSEINQHMIFPTQYIKGLLIKIYDYAIWRNIGNQNQKPNTLAPNNHNKESLTPILLTPIVLLSDPGSILKPCF